MSCRKLFLPAFALMAVVAFAASKKAPPLPPPKVSVPTPAVTDDFIHKQFGANCSLLDGPLQFEGDLDGDGIPDLVVAARCKNPMMDKDEYGFALADPYDAYLGFGDVKVTSTFASDEPERRGISLLIIHGTGPEGWRANSPKAKFVLINMPFRTLTVKRLAAKKRTMLGVYMEEQGEGEDMSSVIFWDGKKYRYQPLGAAL
jgi:hypothetical protein